MRNIVIKMFNMAPNDKLKDMAAQYVGTDKYLQGICSNILKTPSMNETKTR